MQNLTEKLITERKINEKSALLYIKNLMTLNNKEPFNNLSFLRNIEKIDDILDKYQDSTKKTILASIVSILNFYKDKPIYKKIYKHYYKKMMNKAEEIKNKDDQNEKNIKQSENWLNWDDILNIKKEHEEKIIEIIKQKKLKPKEYDILLNYILLLLYCSIPPRRNKDFMEMYIIKKYNPEHHKNINVFDVSNNKLIFNEYKTKKKYGTQIIDISNNEDLINAIHIYFKYNPLNKTKKDITKITNKEVIPLLVNYDGSLFNKINSITRRLNRIFNKKIGSSMLRHIYLSSKYDIDQMKEDAYNMGHSLEEQKKYMKS